MFFSTVSIGTLTDTLLGRTPPDNELFPILLIEGFKNEKRVKTFFLGQAPEDHYLDVIVYFKRHAMLKNSLSLVFKKGKHTDSITLDVNHHMMTLAGMARCRKVSVAYGDEDRQISTVKFDVSSAMDYFESDIKESLLIQMLKKTLKNAGKDPSAAPDLAPKLWEAYEEEWNNFVGLEE